MGEVVRGAAEAGGWSGGSNVPHIIELEGLPEGLSSFWLRPDIYTRMEVMIENSDGFVIFPGGSGTVQELLALLIFQQQENPVMEGKPIVLFNRLDGGGKRFWDPLINLLRQLAPEARFRVVDELGEILPALEEGIQARKESTLAC
jgi:predicted Rossmann-fold nucleotide-binding protein